MNKAQLAILRNLFSEKARGLKYSNNPDREWVQYVAESLKNLTTLCKLGLIEKRVMFLDNWSLPEIAYRITPQGLNYLYDHYKRLFRCSCGVRYPDPISHLCPSCYCILPIITKI